VKPKNASFRCGVKRHKRGQGLNEKASGEEGTHLNPTVRRRENWVEFQNNRGSSIVR